MTRGSGTGTLWWALMKRWAVAAPGTRVSHRAAGARCALRLRRLRRVGAQQAILQRCAIEPANDRVHFVGIWRFDEREALRLLRFRIANDFDRVRYQVFGC